MDGGNDVRLSVSSVGPRGASGTISRSGEGGSVELSLPVDGAHNLLDATAATVAAALVGVSVPTAAAALATFGGVHRRFEFRGSARGADVYDDYGHVPTELAVTLDVARRTRPRRLISLFQPHRYSRTRAMWRELGASLVEADVVVVTDVYGGVRLASPGKNVVYLPHGQDVVDYLDREVREGDLIVTMGCGDVWMLGDATLARLREIRP